MSIFYNKVISFIEKEVTKEALLKAEWYKDKYGEYPSFEEFWRWKEEIFKMYMQELKKKLIEEADAE